MKTIVFPGRFQPFHDAHLIVLKRLLKKYGRVIVAIGSCDIRNRNNPFTARQRKEMISSVVKSKRLGFAFIPCACDARWVGVFLKAVPRKSFDVVFTNNKRVQKQLRLHKIPFVSSELIARGKFEGRKIRLGGKGWEQSVPVEVAGYLERNRLIPSASH